MKEVYALIEYWEVGVVKMKYDTIYKLNGAYYRNGYNAYRYWNELISFYKNWFGAKGVVILYSNGVINEYKNGI